MFSQERGYDSGRRLALLSFALLVCIGNSTSRSQDILAPAAPIPGADPRTTASDGVGTYQPIPEGAVPAEATFDEVSPEAAVPPEAGAFGSRPATESGVLAPVGCAPQGYGSQGFGSRYGLAPATCDDCRNTRLYRSEILGHLWLDAELLAWGTKGQNLPPLVTSTPGGGGASTILFGDEKIHDDFRVGGRFTVGWWWDVGRSQGIEGYYFALDGKENEFLATSTDVVVLPPIVDPSFLNSAIALEVDTEFSGAGALWRRGLSCGPRHRVDLLLGYRFARLYDDLFRDESLNSLDAASGVPIGANISRTDFFQSSNEFHGGELGLQGRWRRNRWSFELLGKVALGGTHTDVTINGSTAIFDPIAGTTTTLNGGVLAQPSNIGRYTSRDFAVVSELGVSLRYEIKCNLSASLGYTFMHWSQVVRHLKGSIRL